MPRSHDPIVESEFLFKWFAIADEMGVPRRRLVEFAHKLGIRLRHWGKSDTTGVILAKQHVVWLKARILVRTSRSFLRGRQ